MRSVAILSVIVLALSGCVNSSKNTYNAADVGRMIETAEGRIVSSRIVNINEEPKGYGPAAGAALGATGAGLGIGSGSGSVLAAVIGGLLGAGAGYLAEQGMRSREGIEYMVRTPDGRTRTLVQNREGAEQPIPPGTPVLIQYAGSYTRVIEKSAAGGDDQWQDPDAGASGNAPVTGGGTATSGAPAPGAQPALPSGGRSTMGDPGRYGTIRPRQQ